MFKEIASKFRGPTATRPEDSSTTNQANRPRVASTGNVDRKVFHRLMLDNVTDADVTALAQILHVGYSKLPGHDFGDKSRELIAGSYRCGRLRAL
jgi:hypothetical protein